jgi:hypothetical protein
MIVPSSGACMFDQAIDFIFDSDWLFMLVVLAIPIALISLQWRLIARTQGPLRLLAATPSLIIALFVVLNVIAPSNIWPIALLFWTAIAFGVHVAVWLLLKFIQRPA